ncbi:membrane hypothetical protein [Vibrio chagasii]|nr:membrane hypothetical protein [Vibrio chagasii]CAH7415352.1 membrane hypothetical protein [Vibrio chagasii]CAH7424522.1 membrane hypothetical protein [Vibrio chagasii]
MSIDINRLKYFFANVAFFWFLSFYPFLVLLNSFGYIELYGLYKVSILLCLVVTTLQMITIHKLKFSTIAVSISLSLFLSVVVLIFGSEGVYGVLDNGVNKSILNYFLPFILNSIAIFIIGYQINIKKIISSKLIFILLLPVVFILLHVRGFRLDYSLLKDPSLIGIYLIVGDALCFSAALFCFRKGVNLSSFFLASFFMVVLYLNNSRAAFFIFSVGVLLTCWLFLITRRTGFALIISVIAIAIIMLFQKEIVTILSLNERMALVFSGSSDYSLNSRDNLLNSGLESISGHWLIGDLGGQINSSGRLGGYIHNILAYWRQFGIVVFILLLLPVLYLIMYMVKMSIYVSEIDMDVYLICLSCLIISTMMIFFARSIPYSLLFLSLSMVDSFRIERLNRATKHVNVRY